jgi:hypothetical protein
MCLSSVWVYPQERDRLIYANLGMKGLVLSLHAGPACGRWLILLTDCAVAMGKSGCRPDVSSRIWYSLRLEISVGYFVLT